MLYMMTMTEEPGKKEEMWLVVALALFILLLLFLVILVGAAALYHNQIISFALPASSALAQPLVPLHLGFPQHTLLQEHWRDIRDEAIEMCKTHASRPARDVSRHFFGTLSMPEEKDKWQLLMLKFYGRRYEDNLRRCPKTAALLKQVEAAGARVPLAMFSILAPGSYIPPHRGPFRGCLRYHLALEVPTPTARDQECSIMVQGQRYVWQQGQGVLFDDTYMHWVRNSTAGRRIVLFCDVQRSLPGAYDWFNTAIIRSPLPRWYFDDNQKQERSTPSAATAASTAQ